MAFLRYEQFYLFGDSITQGSFDQARGFGFGAALQHAYVRRLDVVNRGFSGYNTDQALKILPHILPTPEQATIKFFFVFFGANDAAIDKGDDPSNQHVPLKRYKQNLEAIINHEQVKAHNPYIILVTPGPIDEYQLEQPPTRIAARTKAYADATCELGKAFGVPTINLWKAFMIKAGERMPADVPVNEPLPHEWRSGKELPGSMLTSQNKELAKFLYDGLHFSPTGYQILYDEVMKVISENWPEEDPVQTADEYPFVLPRWNASSLWEKFEVGR